jgi:hypothetical protein
MLELRLFTTSVVSFHKQLFSEPKGSLIVAFISFNLEASISEGFLNLRFAILYWELLSFGLV